MFDNFIEDNYHPCDKVYNHKESGNGIYIGDVQSALDINFLHQTKIKTVVTAAKDMDHINYDSGITHIVYPLLDGKYENIATFFDNFYEIVQKNIIKGGILVHCAAGISRSSTLVISFIMRQQKLSFKEAIAKVRKHRPTVLPNLGFERQLKKYQEGLNLIHNQITNFKRNEIIKTSQSGKSHFHFKQQLPMIDSIPHSKFKRKIVTSNVKNMLQKLTQKDMQVLKVYNSKNDAKNRKFMISKKSTSFSRHLDDLSIRNTPFDHIVQSKQYTKNNESDKKKGKNSMEQMKDIYLPKRNHISVDRRFPTQRGATFYLRGVSSKIEQN